jgi:hypothetical protein
MKLTTDSPLKFKFHFLNPQGQSTTMLARKGSFDGETLILDARSIPVRDLHFVARREQRLVLTVPISATEAEVITLSCSSKKQAVGLKEALDVVRSRYFAEQHRQELAKAGREGSYRDAECGLCGAVILLSDMAATPQLYCPYCDSLQTVQDDGDRPANETQFRICESCHMFSRPEKFTIFYFWFVIVAYGIWTQEHWTCQACMRGKAWKMLWGNLIFVAGVPFALYQLGRAYSGSIIGGAFRGLDTGNVKAIKGDIPGALQQYRAILERVPHSAGIKFNLGQALLMQQNFDQAARSFEAALQDCANYVPAYAQLRQLYSHLGQNEKLQQLDREWGAAEAQAEFAQDEEDAP